MQWYKIEIPVERNNPDFEYYICDISGEGIAAVLDRHKENMPKVHINDKFINRTPSITLLSDSEASEIERKIRAYNGKNINEARKKFYCKSTAIIPRSLKKYFIQLS